MKNTGLLHSVLQYCLEVSDDVIGLALRSGVRYPLLIRIFVLLKNYSGLSASIGAIKYSNIVAKNEQTPRQGWRLVSKNPKKGDVYDPTVEYNCQ